MSKSSAIPSSCACFFFSSRRRHTRWPRDWSSDVCSSDLWELVDSAFRIGGFDIEWDLEGDDPALWRGYFSATRAPAVIVNPQLLRMSEPLIIQVDPSRARAELGRSEERRVGKECRSRWKT